jgi:hypothetical protein
VVAGKTGRRKKAEGRRNRLTGTSGNSTMEGVEIGNEMRIIYIGSHREHKEHRGTTKE